MVHTYIWVSGYSFQKILYLFLSELFVHLQIEKTLKKCSIMLHSFWIFTVCKRTRLMVGLNDLMLALYGGHPINSKTFLTM